MSARTLFLLLAMALASCGEAKGAVFLTIEGVRSDGQALVIPDDVDTADVEVQTRAGESLLAKTYKLEGGGQTFPLTLGVEPGEKSPDELNLRVTLSHAAQAVGAADAAVTMKPGEVTLATVRVVRE